MGNLFRSEEMKLIEVFMQAEAARATLEALGDMGVAQFVDLNSTVTAYNRTFVKEIKRCDDLEKTVNYFSSQCVKYDVTIRPREEGVRLQSMDQVELATADLYASLSQLCNNGEVLEKDLNELRQLQFLLESSATFFDDDSGLGGVGGAVGRAEDSRRLLDDAESGMAMATTQGRGVRFIAGIVDFDADNIQRFQRILWRTTRGNLFMRLSRDTLAIHDPSSGSTMQKASFVVFYQGERIENKLVKIAEAHGATVYSLPTAAAGRRTLQGEISTRVRELDATVRTTKTRIRSVLLSTAVSVPIWLDSIAKDKAIYHELNKLKADVSSKALVGEAWIPTWADEDVARALAIGTSTSGAAVQSFFHIKPTRAMHPTFFRTNKYTRGFQNIVDAYGVANYGEANPGVFAIVTFPFLFGVMFGDIGHGILLSIFGFLLCYKEKEIAKLPAPEMFWTIFNGRYLILAMGLFATYCGFIYNDCFALAVNVFGSNYDVPADGKGTATVIDPDRVYPFGHDPGWAGATNRLAFDNSIKMKLAILLGVAQMLFGIVLSFTNHLKFRNYISIFCEFIPQVLFLLSLFGYMCFLIVLKWVGNLNDPPLVLSVIIDMFLKAGSLPEKDKMFEGQAKIQSFLLLVLFICPPWMLIPKPILLYLKSKSHKPSLAQLDGSEDEHGDAGHDDHGGMGEIIVHQVIHTIEFVLGTVSNTASYLRLWALSLAHAQLSEVIWDQLFFRTLESGSSIQIYVGFALWCCSTVGILMIMESLSSFLHALRLHWVEWMNKFFGGAGIRFTPFMLDPKKHLE